MPAQPRVFLSYARSDGEALARTLRERLQAADVPLWHDRDAMEGGRDWWQQITAAIDQVDFLVLLMTPAALRSDLVRREWRYARQRGAAVYPVLAAPGLDFSTLPRWMRDAHFYDLDHEWRKFVADLHQRPQRVRVPFMVEALPPDFVPRPREFDRLLAQLLDPVREEPIAITTALRGAGGFGKTALACALCHDERIQNAFDDGILWVTLGERPGDLTGRVEDLIHMLSGQRSGFAGLDAAVAALAELLADRALLIVIDDVWDAAHVRPFLQGGPRCARLITTRLSDVLPSGTRRVDVDAMDSAEAQLLLGHGLGLAPAGDAAMARLAQRLGEWPLLLKLVNGALRERVLYQGQPLADALAHVHRALDKRGLTFFDARDAASRHAAVASTLGLSLAQLSADELARFRELAVFPEDADIPLATVAALWQQTGALDEFDSDTLCERCARLSLLLALDLSTRTLRLHDVVRRYLLDGLGDAVLPLHLALVQALRPAAGWLALPQSDRYAWQHLFHHLQAAGLQAELLATALDLRWLSTKHCLRLASSVEADLRLARSAVPGHALLDSLARIHGQSAHLFHDCRSPAEVRATLLARLRPGTGLDDGGELRLRPITRLPDSPHPALLRTLGSRRGAVRTCALSADGRRIATASTDRGLLLWDTETGAELAQVAGGTSAATATASGSAVGSDARALALSADGTRLAVATGHRRLGVWHLGSGAMLADLSGHTDELTDCALSADGRWLLSASLDERLLLWDVATGEVVHSLARDWAEDDRGWTVPTNAQGHWAAVLGCDMTPDARLAASASADQSVIVWDLDSGLALAVLTGHSAAVQDCALSPDGRLVASVGSDRSLRIWDWASREHRAVLAHGAPVMACAFSEDGRSVVTACADGLVRVWAVDGLQLLQTLTGHADAVLDCAVSATAGLVVSAGNDGTARLWQLGTRAEPWPGRQHAGAVLACAAAPDGRHAFTGGDDQSVLLWDVSRGQVRAGWPTQDGGVRACALSADGALLASGGKDRSLSVWRAVDGQLLHRLAGHRGSINSCAFRPGTGHAGQLASVSDDRTVCLWDLATRARRLAWTAHAQWINACTFSPCGRWLVTAAADGSLRRWDLAVDEALWERWLTDPRPLRPEVADRLLSPLDMAGHGASVNHCCFTPDGRLLVSASSDRTLRLWDGATGECLHRLQGHLEGVNGCSVAPDGRRMASVSADGGIRVWRLASSEVTLGLHVDGPLLACAWVGDSRLVAPGALGVYVFDVPA